MPNRKTRARGPRGGWAPGSGLRVRRSSLPRAEDEMQYALLSKGTSGLRLMGDFSTHPPNTSPLHASFTKRLARCSSGPSGMLWEGGWALWGGEDSGLGQVSPGEVEIITPFYKGELRGSEGATPSQVNWPRKCPDPP